MREVYSVHSYMEHSGTSLNWFSHLLLSSIQRLLDSFGEESSSSLEVRAHLVFSHRHFFSSGVQSTSCVLACSGATASSARWRSFRAEEVEQMSRLTEAQQLGERAPSLQRHRSCSHLSEEGLSVRVPICCTNTADRVAGWNSPGNHVCKLKVPDDACLNQPRDVSRDRDAAVSLLLNSYRNVNYDKPSSVATDVNWFVTLKR